MNANYSKVVYSVNVSSAFFLSLLVIPVPCFSQDVNGVVITGHDNYFFSYTNEFGDLENSLERKKNETAGFGTTVHIETEHPLILRFSKDFSLFPIWVQPGDTIYVSYTNNDIEFTGNRNRGELNVLKQIENLFGFSFPPWGGMIFTEKLDFNYYYHLQNSQYRNALNYLSVDSAMHGFSRQFCKSLTDYLRYRYYVGLLAPYTSSIDKKSIPVNYLTKLDFLVDEINKDSLLHNTFYRYFLDSYVLFQCRDSLIKNIDLKVQVIQKSLRGYCRDYIMMEVLKSNINKNQALADTLVSDFLSYAENEKYKNHIRDLIGRRNYLNSPEFLASVELMNLSGGSVSLAEIIGRNKGNFIYIDFWSTSCKPCLEEMKYYKELQPVYSNNGISFIFISIDKFDKVWHNGVKKLPFESSQHFLLDNESKGAIAFGVPPIPRYILIDTNGKIKTLVAPRPSSPDISLIFNQLLDRSNK